MVIVLLRRLCALSLLLACAPASAGPAEIQALEQQLASVKAQIEESQGLLRRALSGYEGDPGEEGVRLRALKIERVRTQTKLKRAIADERERAAADRKASEANKRRGALGQAPAAQIAPAGTPPPAPKP